MGDRSPIVALPLDPLIRVATPLTVEKRDWPDNNYNGVTFIQSCTRIPSEGCQDLTSEMYGLLQPIKTGWRILGLFFSSVHLIS